ncbi:WD40 repeat-like protein [Nadsonia fulvescens var. elongata DSM 6958]|uniref:WD40 repeat-like protein n=1 Tax=Nadsonia fulvescens var. elongata DSM 6958 TaxID=857566 RepID=A0A1E3PPP9_9ASCO|nr:WD40 repeat-like protein [Nadsonia fulvescens var. elongata DSM 6958]
MTDSAPSSLSSVERKTKSFGASNTSATWKINSTVGGKLPGLDPIFTNDKKYFIVLFPFELRVYLFATKQCVKNIPVNVSGASDMYLDEEDKVWIATTSGSCQIVNLQDKSIISTFDFGVPILKIVNIQESENKFLVISSKISDKKDASKKPTVSRQLLELTDSSNGERKDWNVSTVFSVKNSTLSAISNNKLFFALYTSHKNTEQIQVIQLNQDFTINKTVIVNRSRAVSSMSISDAGILAIGSVTGVIDLYYHVFAEPTPSIRALKWHVDSVLSLSFSLDGDYLLSGGKERVLVFWQLETDNMQFLPRLGDDIMNIVVDKSSELYALRLGDDEIVVLSSIDLNSRLQISGVKASFSKLPSEPEKEKRKRKNRENGAERVGDYTVPFYLHPKNNQVYLPINNGSKMQVYDLKRDEQLYVQTIAETLQTGKVKIEEQIQDPQITKVGFTIDGEWMATVDEKVTPPIDNLLSGKDKEINLKFWKHSEKTNKWELATRVNSPHGLGKSIHSVIPAPESYYGGQAFLTASQDGGVKLWRPREPKEIKDKIPVNKAGVAPNTKSRQISWTVRKLIPAGPLTSSAVTLGWSDDASVIVLGFETSIYIIDAQTFEVTKTLPNIMGSRCRSLHIVGTYIVALSKTRVAVYDLLNDRLNWSIQVWSPQGGHRLLAFDRVNNRFALSINYFTTEFKPASKIFIFTPETPLPLHIQYHNNAVSALRNVQGTSNYIFIDINSRIHILSFSGRSSYKSLAQSTLSPSVEFTKGISVLYSTSKQNIVSQQASSIVAEEDQVEQVLSVHTLEKVFDGSEYNIMNIETMFEKVLGTINKPLPKN